MTYNQYNLIRHKMEEKEKGKKIIWKTFLCQFHCFSEFQKKFVWSVFTSVEKSP